MFGFIRRTSFFMCWNADFVDVRGTMDGKTPRTMRRTRLYVSAFLCLAVISGAMAQTPPKLLDLRCTFRDAAGTATEKKEVVPLTGFGVWHVGQFAFVAVQGDGEGYPMIITTISRQNGDYDVIGYMRGDPPFIKYSGVCRDMNGATKF